MPKGGMAKDGDKSGDPSDADKAAAKSSSSGQARSLALPRCGREASGVSSTQWPVDVYSRFFSCRQCWASKAEARHLWDIIDTGVGEYDNDRSAMEAILCAVPAEMIPALAVKETAKEAWDAIKTIRVGAARVRDCKAQNLRT
ncbi:hypothetical protein QYE76_065640 [Lolium multiflorum]|uniref:Uncharacterized protein n=1 Tax=Lolium multiflorum TaxID=4521 RepID=A0AAD8SBA7_LOLMU|nr:hypothetical protein QYE76_065640 [Lolium multiflorum]